MSRPVDALQRWLDARVSADAGAWLRDAVQRVTVGGDRELFTAVSLAARKLGKASMTLTATELATAAASRPGWDPSAWTVDQAARVCLLLASTTEPERFASRLDALCATADVDELVAFYRGLPLYPDPPRHRLRAAEGLRSNMKVVFEAVAHRNPYPAEQLHDEAWNQMVLKALFVGSALDPIVGLDRRANPRLARMLHDYARERWAARRHVSPELWRCVGPFASGEILADLERLLVQGSPAERAAATLALRSARDPEAFAVLERHHGGEDAIALRGTAWRSVLEFD